MTIEDDVFLGPSMTFTNDMFPRAFSTDWEITETVVRRGASNGASATIVCGVTIGEYAMVGAGAVVIRDVPPHALVVGNPARQIGLSTKIFSLLATVCCSLPDSFFSALLNCFVGSRLYIGVH